MGERETQSVEGLRIELLIAAVDSLKSEGWRLVQILALSTAGEDGEDGAYELNYSFGKSLAFKTLRLKIALHDAVPSITAVFPAAFLYENEIHDLFGVNIERIGVDFAGKVYDVASEKPFMKAKVAAVGVESGIQPGAVRTALAPQTSLIAQGGPASQGDSFSEGERA